MSTVTVRIENTYEDGHESTREVHVTPPEGTDDESLGLWWEEIVLPHTGDGHGIEHPKLGVLYEATVTAADDADDAWLVGQSMEWD